MVVDETAEDVPVRDSGPRVRPHWNPQDPTASRDERPRLNTGRLRRREIEDRFLQLFEENSLLKEHLHRQDSQVKKLASKLLRAGSGQTKAESDDERPWGQSGRSRDREEHATQGGHRARARVRTHQAWSAKTLDAQRGGRNECRQDQSGHTRGYVERLRRGLRFHHEEQRALRGLQTAPVRSDDHRLYEAWREIRRLESVISRELEPILRNLRQELRDKSQQHQETLLELRRLQTEEQREIVHENVEMIKVKKKLSDKCQALCVLEEKYQQIQESQRADTTERTSLLSGVEHLTQQLKEERERNRTLQARLEMVSATQRNVDQLQEQLCEVTKERDILKEGYNQLLASESIGWKMYNVKSDITSPIGQQPLQPMAGLQPELQFDRRGFRQRDSDDRDLPGIGGDGRQAGWELRELQAVHAEAVQELEKARTMLLTQSKINRHFQSEVKILRKQIEDGDRDAETRSRQDHMFHIRSGRTQMLEAPQRDTAPGPGRCERGERSEGTARPGAGLGLLELHVHRATLTAGILGRLCDADPATFCTYAVYDFETEATPVVRGPRPLYNFTSQYAARPGVHFLRHLRSASARLELHLALGAEFQTLASANIPLGQALGQDRRIHGTIPLIDIDRTCRSIGELEYWVRYRAPKDEAIGPSDVEAFQPLPRSAHGQQGATLRPLQVTSRVQEVGKDAKTGKADKLRSPNRAPSLRQTDDSSETQTEDSSRTQSTDSDQIIQFTLGDPAWPARERLRVEVLWLSLSPSSRAARDRDVRQLYVEYLIPGVPLRETETPISLRKPRDRERIHFNFSKVIHLDADGDWLQREFLYSLINQSEPNGGRLKFTVVSEPVDGNEDCIEIGYCYVPISRIYQTGSDIIETEFDILEAGRETAVMGKLAVTVEGATALQAIVADMSGGLTSQGEGHQVNLSGGNPYPGGQSRFPHGDRYEELVAPKPTLPPPF
ncbi:protein fantom-like [Scyliorhinus torazame]|uniref:protein fantom-like n=1 Tax=Scyliorhinus torazame TaxID=75743 RepID=UPI003B5AA104